MENQVMIVRRPLSPRSKRNITLLRFGSLDDFTHTRTPIPTIAKLLHIPYTTCHHFL
jgi:hypothetical protein